MSILLCTLFHGASITYFTAGHDSDRKKRVLRYFGTCLNVIIFRDLYAYVIDQSECQEVK
jgi:hypothetical protein